MRESIKKVRKFGDARGGNLGWETWPSDDRQIVLFDHRGRTQWSSALEEDDDLLGRDFFESVEEEDRGRIKQLYAKCIIEGHRVEYITNGVHAGRREEGPMCPFHVTLFPLSAVPGSAVCGVVRVIPSWELDEQDLKLIQLAADDHPIKEIAALMHRSVAAIETRIRNLKNKTGKTTLTGVVAEAFRRNLL